MSQDQWDDSMEEPPWEDPGPPPDLDGPGSWDEFPPGESSKGSRQRNRRQPDDEDLSKRVLETLRVVLSTLHERPTALVQGVVERIMASPRVLKQLDEKHNAIFEGVFEVLLHESSVIEGAVLDLNNLEVAREYSTPVRIELAVIAGETGLHSREPHSVWQALVEAVQSHHSRNAAQELIDKINAKASVAEKMEAFKKLEPPTAQKSAARARVAKTAKAVSAQHRAANAGRAPLRFSSGWPTLDKGYTAKEEPLGFVAPGQMIVVMGPTGTGKTSFSYGITPALTLDMQNQGLGDAKHVVFHTEEEAIDKVKGFRADVGQRYAHLNEMLVVENVGSSRQRIAMTLYDLVIDADERARATKRPITDFLPYIVQLDYIQAIKEQGENDVDATATTAEFILRGVCAWDPEELGKFSGLDFREYAGMGWPEGMEQHRVAVIAYAQLVKIQGETEYYKPGPKVSISDYAQLDEKDDPRWEVKEGDLRLFTKGQMRGSGVIANNAHAIVILHRSVPNNNPAITLADGTRQLMDTRARILFEKARGGITIPYAPMRFDLQVDGPKAQYFDEVAERAVAAGRLTSYDREVYTSRGDPILPVRPAVDPLASFKY